MMEQEEQKQIKESSSKPKACSRKKKIIVNVKVPANVKNPDKAIDLMGGKSELIKVIIHLTSI